MTKVGVGSCDASSGWEPGHCVGRLLWEFCGRKMLEELRELRLGGDGVKLLMLGGE